jgi:predicted nucleic acid-binding protein
MRCVLDASMAMSFVLDDEFTAQSKRVLALVAREGALVPAVWEAEILNALRSAEKRGRLSPAALANAVHGLASLPIERDHRPADGLRLTTLAHEFDLSVYDAMYLALALDSNLPLAALDARLLAAAKGAGAHIVR